MQNEIKNELEQAAKYYDIIVEFFVNYSFILLGAMLIMVAGYIVARKVSLSIFNLCIRRKLDVTLSGFISSVIKVFILVPWPE